METMQNESITRCEEPDRPSTLQPASVMAETKSSQCNSAVAHAVSSDVGMRMNTSRLPALRAISGLDAGIPGSRPAEMTYCGISGAAGCSSRILTLTFGLKISAAAWCSWPRSVSPQNYRLLLCAQLGPLASFSLHSEQGLMSRWRSTPSA